jgi:hypothetical protein
VGNRVLAKVAVGCFRVSLRLDFLGYCDPMSAAQFSVQYTEPRNRLTNLVRGIMVIPHVIVMNAWQYLAQVLGFIQWWIILFTGKRNRGIWNMQNAWLGYAARVNAYWSLMFDKWPNIGPEPNGEPTSYSFNYNEQAHRVSNFFRIIWAIPALLIAFFIMVGATVITIVCWFVIVLSGKQPRGLFGFLNKVHQFMTQLNSYLLLMTDSYPKY